jgi:hypothetical protein
MEPGRKDPARFNSITDLDRPYRALLLVLRLADLTAMVTMPATAAVSDMNRMERRAPRGESYHRARPG